MEDASAGLCLFLREGRWRWKGMSQKPDREEEKSSERDGRQVFPILKMSCLPVPWEK